MRQPPTARGERDPHDLAGKDKLGGYLEGRKIVCQRFRFAQHAALQNVQRKLVAPPLGPLGRMKPAGFRLVVQREPTTPSACKLRRFNMPGACIRRASHYIGPASLLAEMFDGLGPIRR
jgi:hypothetical protein